MTASEPRLVIVRNPRSRHALSEAALNAAAAPLRVRGWRVDVQTTRAPGDARALAAQAAQAGASIVAAAGGDGTVNEVANGLAFTECALAVIPAGTANVWAREAGYPRRAADVCRIWITQARRVRVDLGVVRAAGREQRFLLMCGIGLDGDIVRRVEGSATKRRFGRAGYAAVAVRTTLGARPVATTVTLGGATLERQLLQLVAGNTRLYGGVARITAGARIDDGLLDVCMLSGAGLPAKARLTFAALRGNLDRRSRRGVDYERTATLDIVTNPPAHVQADGEYIGETPATIRVEPSALTVLLSPEPNVLLGER